MCCSVATRGKLWKKGARSRGDRSFVEIVLYPGSSVFPCTFFAGASSRFSLCLWRRNVKIVYGTWRYRLVCVGFFCVLCWLLGVFSQYSGCRIPHSIDCIPPPPLHMIVVRSKTEPSMLARSLQARNVLLVLLTEGGALLRTCVVGRVKHDSSSSMPTTTH